MKLDNTGTVLYLYSMMPVVINSALIVGEGKNCFRSFSRKGLNRIVVCCCRLLVWWSSHQFLFVLINVHQRASHFGDLILRKRRRKRKQHKKKERKQGGGGGRGKRGTIMSSFVGMLMNRVCVCVCARAHARVCVCECCVCVCVCAFFQTWCDEIHHWTLQFDDSFTELDNSRPHSLKARTPAIICCEVFSRSKYDLIHCLSIWVCWKSWYGTWLFKHDILAYVIPWKKGKKCLCLLKKLCKTFFQTLYGISCHSTIWMTLIFIKSQVAWSGPNFNDGGLCRRDDCKEVL